METLTKEELIEFENEIKDLYSNAKIKSPVHLSLGNEDDLIKIFKKINKDDWVFSTHRNHYHALLKGISREWLKKEILENKSMHINNKEHKFLTSSIVGGVLPIAVGTALALKLKESKNRVWAFTGDMGSEMGVFHECVKYARRNNLPITFVVEDNELSVNTPTKVCWGCEDCNENVIEYKYKRGYPHHGVGEWVDF